MNVGGIAVQVGAFHRRSNALAVQTSLRRTSVFPVIIVLEEGYYKVRISGLKGMKEAKNYLMDLRSDGFQDAFIIRK